MSDEITQVATSLNVKASTELEKELECDDIVDEHWNVDLNINFDPKLTKSNKNRKLQLTAAEHEEQRQKLQMLLRGITEKLRATT